MHLWHIKYDDGDSEDFEENEMDAGVKLYRKTKKYVFIYFLEV